MEEAGAGPLRRYLTALRRALLDPHRGEAVLRSALASRERPVPVIWLLGKTQSGKTSIISALTGHPRALVGTGYAPCTRTAMIFDCPAEVPVIRFLDTRGLGEVAYDPAEDIAACASQAHLIVAVCRAADPQQDAVFDVLREVRKRHGDWAIVVAQTGLHDLYEPGQDHLQPYPFAGDADAIRAARPELLRALEAQRERLGRLPGAGAVHWVPIDLTQPEDGYGDRNYGLPALWDAIEAVLPQGLAAVLRRSGEAGSGYAQAARAQILYHTVAAMGGGALPVVDIVAVAAIQAKLLHVLAVQAGQVFDLKTTREFLGLLGAGVAGGLALRLLGRSLLKLVPVLGQSIGAVWGGVQAGATTYALGWAAARYFEAKSLGRHLAPERLREIYAEELRAGRALIEGRLRGQP
ncbi:GTPase [Fontimonas sp. SYSU GA230001]|uniref:GTPase family protein n=1 Tax=Fontimonas sp. SYSU GA230001 TaxID=3142450 RepID=UPI0032B4BF2A